uniref:Putative secreted protein n=1 Tax=Amblyomma cajennense TaxID=34607 RepID=A0A023FE43_AMBCJ
MTYHTTSMTLVPAISLFVAAQVAPKAASAHTPSEVGLMGGRRRTKKNALPFICATHRRKNPSACCLSPQPQHTPVSFMNQHSCKHSVTLLRFLYTKKHRAMNFSMHTQTAVFRPYKGIKKTRGGSVFPAQLLFTMH